jgi:molecular chaperone DnaK (HSP70)
MIQKLQATNTGETVLALDLGDTSQLIAFVGREEVELVVNKSDTLKIPRAIWNSFAGCSLQMARECQ